VGEVLVLLSASAPWTARGLVERAPVDFGGAQLFGDRVLLARLNTADVVKLTAIEGVSGVYTDVVPTSADLPADPAGRVAVAAWNARRRPKQRIGDGVAWDDPRFEPEGRPGPEGD
jgi:hypothetical protein